MQAQYFFLTPFLSTVSEVLDEGNVAFWELVPHQNRIQIWGGAYLRAVYGIDREEWGCPLNTFVDAYCHPDERRRVRGEYYTILPDALAYHSRFRIQNRRTKQWRWHYCFGNVFEDEGGNPVVRGAARDIQEQTEIEQTYAQLREADERTQMMLDATPLCCTLWNENIEIIDCNREAMLLFHLPSKQDIITQFDHLSPPMQPGGASSPEALKAHVRRAFQAGRETFEWLHQTMSGDAIPSEITMVRLKWRDSRIIASYTRDLREQKAHLAEIEQTQRELLRARDAAEQSARAKSEFLANMSHELRTPMNAILGMAGLVLRGELTEQQRFYMEKADQSSRSLLRIVNDILDFSKIEAGKLEMEQAAFSLLEVMRAAGDITREELTGKELEVATHISPDVPDHLCGDALRLKQVLINLLSNAIKFTAKGGITVSVKRVGGAGDSVELRFSVADTGIGLSQEQIGRLFTPFTQGDASTTRKYGGTGLGLAICSSIVEQMNGSIWCESEPGRGSTFSFTACFGCEEGGLPGMQGVDAFRIPDRIRGSRILLVEDNEINRILAKELLEMENFRVEMAENGAQALKKLRSGDYDLVLMDIQMPEMDGLTATREIRRDPSLRELPILAMTAHAVQEDLRKSLAAGMNGHVTKPIEPERLYRALAEWI